jgi:serine/threonine protein kinase
MNYYKNESKYEGDKNILTLTYNYINKFYIPDNKCDDAILNFVNLFPFDTNDRNIKNIKTIKNIKNNIIDEAKLIDDIELINPYFKMKPYMADRYIYHINTGAFGITLRINESFCFKISLKPINDQIHEFRIPYILSNLLKNGSNMDKLVLVPYTLVKDINLKTFKNIFYMHNIILILIDFILDNVAYDLNIYETYKDYSKMDVIYKVVTSDEDLFYRYFTYFYKKYFNEFDIILINNYSLIIKHLCDNKNLFKNKDILGSIIIMPLAICASHELKLIKYNNSFIPDMNKGIIAYQINNMYLRHLVLQTLLLILGANTEETIFFHNDLKPNNILVFPNMSTLIIKYKDKNITFKEKYMFKITDFDLSNIIGYENIKLNNTIHKNFKNIITDIYYFFSRFKNDFFVNLDKIDPKLNTEIDSRFLLEKYKKDTKKSHYYYGNKTMKVSYIEDFIFKSGLFEYWL